MSGGVLALLAIFMHVLIQGMLLLLLTPFCAWLLENALRWLYGLSTPPIGLDYRAFGAFFVRSLRTGLAPPQGFALSIALLVLATTPGLPMGFVSNLFGSNFTQMMNDAEIGSRYFDLADILLTGGLLLLAGGCVQRLPPFSALFGVMLILCLTEGLFVLAAPGMSSLQASAQATRLLPDSGLIGTSACCALALALLAPLPGRKPEKSLLRPLTLFPPEISAAYRVSLAAERAQKEQNALLTMPLQTGWLLLLGDMLLPGFMGGEGGFGLLGLLLRLAAALAVIVFIQFAGIARQPRLIALLGGLALLLALAGRFAL